MYGLEGRILESWWEGILVKSPWLSPIWQSKNHSRYQCRCNKRSCQARVTRKKHPLNYKVKKYQTCDVYGCKGKLYVDWFRMWKGNSEKDSGVICNCTGRPLKHRLGQYNCIHRDSIILNRSLRDRPKHSPIKNQDTAPF